MIREINTRLQHWAWWVLVGRRSLGLGYGHCLLGDRFKEASSSVDLDPRLDDDALAIDAAINQIPEPDRVIVREFYVGTGSWPVKCHRLGLSRAGLSRALDRIHHDLVKKLDENSQKSWPKQSVFSPKK